jgi:hypothetical protein
LKPLCDLCNTRHESYQAHVFATNTKSATNGVRLTDGTRKQPQVEEKREVARGADRPASGDVAVAEDARSKNRRSRDAYNAYQREYMRKRRAAARQA